MNSVHRCPSDWPESSYTPDMAHIVDSLEDQARELARDFWRGAGVPTSRAQLIQGSATLAVQLCRRMGGERTGAMQAQEMTARLLATIIDAGEDAQLTAQCMDFAIGTNVQGSITEQQIAEQHGLTRAAVSKRCIKITEEFNVPPSAGMRTLKARGRYRLRQRGRRTVLIRPKWAYSGLLRDILHEQHPRPISV